MKYMLERFFYGPIESDELTERYLRELVPNIFKFVHHIKCIINFNNKTQYSSRIVEYYIYLVHIQIHISLKKHVDILYVLKLCCRILRNL